MINSISAYGTSNLMNVLMSGQSQMNQLRLQQALAGKNASSISPIGKTGAALSNDAQSFLKEYRTRLDDLESSAKAVLSNGKNSDRRAAAAQDSAIAEVSGRLANASDEYELTVEKLASGQVNRSVEMLSSGALPSMSGRIQLKTEKGTFNVSLSAAGASTNKEMLENFASKINAAASGVTASVVEKDGMSSLRLEGGSGAFSVSGTLAERLGIDLISQQAQDAVYTVSKNGGEAQRFTSQSNQIAFDGMTATLKKAGSTKVTAGMDSAVSTADALEKMVDSFNSALGYLNKNADRGLGVLQQMKRMLLPPASERSMALAGVSVRSDGTLSLDRDQFLAAFKEAPSLIGGIVETIAEGVRSDARQGMSVSSASLVSGESAQSGLFYQNDSIKFLKSYSRNGVYNIANYYAVGVLMNLNI